MVIPVSVFILIPPKKKIIHPSIIFPFFKRWSDIAALLSPGKANGRKCAELAATVGTDGRSLRRAIQAERQAGALILSSTETGYFLPDSVDELREFVISMRHRAKAINSVCRAAENALADATGQTVIEGW